MQVHCWNLCFFRSLKSASAAHDLPAREVPVIILSGLQKQNIDGKVFLYPKRLAIFSEKPSVQKGESYGRSKSVWVNIEGISRRLRRSMSRPNCSPCRLVEISWFDKTRKEQAFDSWENELHSCSTDPQPPHFVSHLTEPKSCALPYIFDAAARTACALGRGFHDQIVKLTLKIPGSVSLSRFIGLCLRYGQLIPQAMFFVLAEFIGHGSVQIKTTRGSTFQ